MSRHVPDAPEDSRYYGVHPRHIFTDEPEDPFIEADCGHRCAEEEIGSDGKCVNCTTDK